MIESTHHCGHTCCDTPNDPFHDHFLDAAECPPCVRDRERLAGIEAASNLLAEKLAAAPAAVAEAVLSDEDDHQWPVSAVDVIADALVVSPGMGQDPLHISDVYTHHGQAIVILDALIKAGFDLREVRA